MKKRYLIPQMVEVKMRQMLLQQTSPVNSTGGNGGVGYGSGSAGGGRAPKYDTWNNDDEGYDVDME